MSVTGSTIAHRAARILNDTDHVRWTLEEMAEWLSSGQREICIYKPNAVVKTVELTISGYPLAWVAQAYTVGQCVRYSDANYVCIKNATSSQLPSNGTYWTAFTDSYRGTLANDSRQEIPADGTQFLKVTRNVNGRAITSLGMNVLDDTIPDWHESTAGTVLKYSHDPVDPKVFYLYPRPNAGIEIVYCAVPTDFGYAAGDVTGTLSTLGYVDEIYETTLLDYVLYRAYSKDSEHTANAQLAQVHYAAFLQAVSSKSKTEVGYAKPMEFSRKPPQPQQG